MKIAIALILGVAMHAEHAKAASPVCPDPVTLSCLKKNFAIIYQNDYERFFGTFHKFEKDASSCRSLKATTEFLDLAGYIQGNAEVGEAFAKAVEKLLVINPKCFLDASASLSGASQKALVQQYLKGPIFEESQKIEEIMKERKNEPKYLHIMEHYFKQ